jgi:hypothetical protein
MLYYQDKQKVTVWKLENKGNYTEVQMSTSRKDKTSGKFVNSSWSFVKFVGDAHKKANTLQRGDRIELNGAGESKEPYTDKEGKVQYPKNPQQVVFNFSKIEKNNAPSSQEDVPSVEEESPFG